MSPEFMECQICKGVCAKRGVRNGVQKWQCRDCKKYSQSKYIYGKCTIEKEQMIVQLNCEGCGISSIARITKLSKTTVVRKIKSISLSLEFHVPDEELQIYEMDELRTYVGNKKTESWVMYAQNKTTGTVPVFAIGRRTSKNLCSITQALLSLQPRKICTDRLNSYPGLIPRAIHEIKHHETNHIERMNLNLRHFLKRLSRKTIAYSKSEEMLLHCCRIFFYNFNQALKITA